MMPPILQQSLIGQEVAREAPRMILGIKDVPEPQHDRFWQFNFSRRRSDSAASTGLRIGKTATGLTFKSAKIDKV